MKQLRDNSYPRILLKWIAALLFIGLNCHDKSALEIGSDIPVDLNNWAIEQIQATPLEYPVRFVLMGDVQPPGYERFARMIEQINDLYPPPVFVVVLGDLTDVGSKAEFKSYTDILPGFDMPVVSIIGNHEQYDKDGVPNFRVVIGEEDFYFDYHGFRFIGINDSRPNRYGLEDYQLNWLENVLASVGDKLVYIFMHITLLPESYHGEEFYSILDKHRDKIVFLAHGHKHSYARFTVEDFPCLISGGGGGGLSTEWSIEHDGFLPEIREIMYHFIEIGVTESGDTHGRVFRLDQGTNPDQKYNFMFENPRRAYLHRLISFPR